MSTPPASGAPDDRTALEPIHVVRPRRTDALAQLLDEIRQDKDYRTHTTEVAALPRTPTGDTEELPPVPGGRTEELPAHGGDVRPPRPVDRPRLGPGQRRAAMVIAIAAAAVAGFGCSLLIPSPTEATPAAPPASASAAPTSAAPSTAGAADALTNPGFESGSVSPWSCAGNPGSIVTSPSTRARKPFRAR